ncbi:prefoldin subunit 1-like [Convolutriloba macropyga]|uniref:prefoldin subunit 1-like n=1 Tax=Convolutriloba macropyga TaxID=536237 RepID=UPI003F527788
MNSGIADPELRKAFNELQMKVVDTQNKLTLADQQIAELQQKTKRKEVAQKQLEIFPTETKMYFGCGKMFVLDEKSEILTKMGKDVEVNAEKIKALESQKELLKRNQKEAEGNIREMIAVKRQTTTGQSAAAV